MNEIVFKKLPNYFSAILSICSSVIGILLLYYNPLGFSSNIIQLLYILPILLLIWLWINYFFLYKNYVCWNNKVIQIKVNRRNTVEIMFEKVSDILFEQDKLIITSKNNQKKVFNLENISLMSIEKLKQILQTNSKPQH
jgi:hypothetical protein